MWKTVVILNYDTIGCWLWFWFERNTETDLETRDSRQSASTCTHHNQIILITFLPKLNYIHYLKWQSSAVEKTLPFRSLCVISVCDCVQFCICRQFMLTSNVYFLSVYGVCRVNSTFLWFCGMLSEKVVDIFETWQEQMRQNKTETTSQLMYWITKNKQT